MLKNFWSLLPGLILGVALFMFSSVLFDECDYRPVDNGGGDDNSLPAFYDPNYVPSEEPRVSYSYGFSFALAVLAFLAAEASAVLCFMAFVRRFDSEVSLLSHTHITVISMLLSSQEDFVKTLPGMERRMNEHHLSFHFPPHPGAASNFRITSTPAGIGPASRNSTAPSELSQQEIPLMKGGGGGGSFGHHHMSGDSSQDSLYAIDERRRSMASASAESNATRTSHCHTETIPVTAEIVYTGGGESSNGVREVINGRPAGYSEMPDYGEVMLRHHRQQQQHQSRTLPRNIDYTSAVVTSPPLEQQPMPPVAAQVPSNNVLKRGSYAGVTTSSSTSGIVGGGGAIIMNGGISGENGGFSTFASNATTTKGGIATNGDLDNIIIVNSPPSRAAVAMATMPRGMDLQQQRKKKSVTIGTFTTVESSFEGSSNNGGIENDSNFSSAV